MRKIALIGALLLVQSLCALAPARAQNGSDYFKQFIYRKEMNGSDVVQYHFLITKVAEIVLPTGEHIAPDITLYLMEDGSYTMYYYENLYTGASNADGSRPITPGHCHLFKGKWNVPNDTLLLDDVAVGIRYGSDNRNQVSLKLARDIEHAGMAGREIILDYGVANTGLDGPDFCF